MAITALYSAATGLRALSTRIDVVSNNLANAETTAFKSSRVNFEDLMYTMLKQPGSSNAAGEISPAGIFVGLGTRISNTQLNLDPGTLESTGRQLDVAIQGQGFLRVKLLDGIEDGLGYTRIGSFFVNNIGNLVLGSGDGYQLQPKISVPTGATDISIATDGTVSYSTGGSTTKGVAGQIKLTQFLNAAGLKELGGGIFTETPASGKAVEVLPGKAGSGTILQGFLEGSNVDPVKELVTLIKTQRAFELNSQSIQTADQALQTIGNLRRG